MLAMLAKGALAYPLIASHPLSAVTGTHIQQSPVPPEWALSDDELMEEIVSRAFLFFWTESGKHTGLVRDRALADGGDHRRVASIAATGFGLAAMCIGHKLGYLPPHEIGARVVATLSFVLNHVDQVNGFFYHFIDINTGKRLLLSEVSPIDTTILLCGVLMAREYFHNAEITHLADTIYRRIDWRWMLNGGKTFAMGWTPEYKFIGARWDTYCELMMMYLLAIGAPTYNIPPSSWNAFSRPIMSFEGDHTSAAPIRCSCTSTRTPGSTSATSTTSTPTTFRIPPPPLARTNYFACPALALSRLQREHLGHHSVGLAPGLPGVGRAAGDRELDGTVVPCAAGGSVPFLPKRPSPAWRICTQTRAAQRGRSTASSTPSIRVRLDRRRCIGIDQGITMLMVENYRTRLHLGALHEGPRGTKGDEAGGLPADGASHGCGSRSLG